MTLPTEFWWVRFWGLAGPDDDFRALREAFGSKPGVAGPFWARADAEAYAMTCPAKAQLVKTPVGTDQRPAVRVS